MRVLAADVGGTKTWLALFEMGEGARLIREAKFASGEHAAFEEMASQFLGDDRVERVGIGVAGPVDDGVAKTTNLPWTLDRAALKRSLGATEVTLVNDFTAIALGIDVLDDAALTTLQKGDLDASGARLIVGAGTGLGVGVVAGHPLASEGGHTAFAPRDDVEDELLRFARAESARVRNTRVSNERIVSGPGLALLYRFFAERESTSDAVRRAVGEVNGGEVASGAAEGDAAAVAALDRFVSLYGAIAGDLALVVLPRAGLYIAGGIAPKLHAQLGARFATLFLDGFRAKGRMSELVGKIPITLIEDPKVGLLGAREAACSSLAD